MAAVITIQSSSPAASHPSSADHPLLRHRQPASSASTPLSPSSAILPPTANPIARAPGRDGSSCDACLRRKSRCAMNEMVNKCYSCDFHRQECTFTLSAPNDSKKRKLDESDDVECAKRQSVSVATPVSSKQENTRPHGSVQHVLTSGFWSESSKQIGLTTELENSLLDYIPLDHNQEGVLPKYRVRKFDDYGTFMRVMDPSQGDSQTVSLDAIESLVAPYGATLIDKYFDHVHPTFPILMEDAFRQSYRARKGLSPLLLCAVYVLALKFVDVGPASQSARRPDVQRLESTALKMFTDSLPQATMATIQAGLLLMERSSLATSALNAQLVTAGFELGLHQDCSNWKLEDWEKGLRKRLAWALYMQDKWACLVHGRPSHIFSFNWTVKDLVEQDFTDAFHSDAEEGDDSSVGHGPLYFCHMVSLTTIISDILDRFYTLQAIEEFKSAGANRTRMILERAKPAQIRLKDWFGRLPPQLKMESAGDIFDTITEDNARNGALHLSYFATEITLHRCIIRSLTTDTADAYLSHICRSAAKTRLISAMDFVNRLRPPHLRSFWPSASRSNFSLIGSFGILLRISAPTKEESEFYRLRLCEYRWTLSVSKKYAPFLDFSLESLDNGTSLGQHVPAKPGIDELMASAAKPTTRVPASIQIDESVLEIEPSHDSGLGGTSSVISGLASPATSVSDDDTPIPPL
ncbi:hypothetical protein AWENTII_012548 [Aspergillus wentii]|nr:Fungal specific transcription factor [Aspergillus wentii]